MFLIIITCPFTTLSITIIILIDYLLLFSIVTGYEAFLELSRETLAAPLFTSAVVIATAASYGKRMDSKFENIDKKMDSKFENIDKKMDKLEEKVEKIEINMVKTNEDINGLKSRFDALGILFAGLVGFSAIINAAIMLLKYFQIGPEY